MYAAVLKALTMEQRPLVDHLKSEHNFDGMKHLMQVYEEIYLFRNGHWQLFRNT